MSLIKCAECGKEFSDKGSVCPNCACPIEEEKDTNTRKKFIIFISVISLIILIIVATIHFSTSPKNDYIGKWEHTIDWRMGGEPNRESYASFELFEGGTFEYNGYDINNSDNKSSFNGTYKVNNNIIYINYEYEGQRYTNTLFINNGTMCLYKEDCEDYYVKSDSEIDNHLVLEDGVYITFEDYQNLLNNKETAVVVVVGTNCKYSREYRKTVNKVSNDYSIPFYYYEIDFSEENKIDVEATPTTLLIQNGNLVDSILGKTGYEDLAQKVNSLINNNSTSSEPTPEPTPTPTPTPPPAPTPTQTPT